MQVLQQDRLVPGIIMTAGISCSFCIRGDFRSLFPAIMQFDFAFIRIKAFLTKLLVLYSSCVVLMQL